MTRIPAVMSETDEPLRDRTGETSSYLRPPRSGRNGPGRHFSGEAVTGLLLGGGFLLVEVPRRVKYFSLLRKENRQTSL